LFIFVQKMQSFFSFFKIKIFLGTELVYEELCNMRSLIFQIEDLAHTMRFRTQKNVDVV